MVPALEWERCDLGRGDICLVKITDLDLKRLQVYSV